MYSTAPPPNPAGAEHASSLVLVNVKATAAHSSPPTDPSPTVSLCLCRCALRVCLPSAEMFLQWILSDTERLCSRIKR